MINCSEQLSAQCDTDRQQHRGVVASDEAIITLRQTLKNIGCTDYQNIPRKQLAHLLALDELEREQILKTISQFTPGSITASGSAEVSVVQYLEDVLNHKAHYTAMPEESASSSSTEETVECQQEPQIRTTDNDHEPISNLPITLSLSQVAAYHDAQVNIKAIIKDSFNVSNSGTSFVIPELSVLIAHLEALRETDLLQDDVNILLDIAKACQQNSYFVHAVCIYALLYRAKEKNTHRDTYTLLFYQEQLSPLLSQKPCGGKQIAFQSAQGTFHQPVEIKKSDTWIDVALRFKQSSLMHYLLSHDEFFQDFSIQSTGKEASDGVVEVERETVLHRLCCSGIADLSLYQRFIKIWPQALSARTPDFHLPLHKAACFADQNVFHYLAEKTIKSWVQADSQGNTLLHLAAMYANTKTVDLLLQQSVDANAVNEDKCTPLHCAAAGRQLDQGSTLADYEAVFNSLLAQGAESTCVDSHQRTARDMVRASGNGRLLDVFDKALNRTAPERLWQYWQTAMMSHYTKETFVKKRLFNEDYFSLADYFVNLQVVKKRDGTTEKQQPNDDKPTCQPLRERDRLVGEKEVIKLANLFQPSIYPNSHGKSLRSINTVVLSGAAGVGKTTLMDYLVYQWALFKQGRGETGLWSRFETVLMVRCRDLHPEQIGSDIRTITQLLHRACWGSLRLSADDAQLLLARLEQSPARCLLLLDGLDELPEPKQTYWRDLLVQLFQLPFKKLVTTRPYAIGTLQKWISHDELVEISGFTDSNVAAYFEKVLGQSNETQAFIQAVKKNRDLWDITHIPIHAYLLKSWWVSTCSQTGSAQLAALSTSDLYRSLIVDVCRRYLVKTGKLNGSELLDDEVVLDDSRVHCLLKTLGYWAFEGLRQNTAQLSTRWLSGVQGSDEEPTLLWANQFKQLNVDYLKALGLLKQVGNNISTQQRFEFLHLSFQEFLAASAIAVILRIGTKDEKTRITHVIHAYKYHLNFTLVWPMVSGLLKGYPSVLNDFLSHLIAGSRDWVGFAEFELLMRCLESSLALNTDTSTLCSQQQGLLQIIRPRIQQFGTLPYIWWKPTLNILSTCPKLARLNAGAILSSIQELNPYCSTRCIVASSAIASLSENSSFVDAVLALLRNPRENERDRCKLAASAVASLPENRCVVEAVLTLLQDSRVSGWDRCQLASSAVASLSENHCVVEAVLTLLRDPSVDRRARYYYLAKTAIASLSENSGVVETIFMLLQQDENMKGYRCKLAADMVASLPENSDVVEKVLMLLQDSSVDVEARCRLAISTAASLLKNPDTVEVVFMLLRDQRVKGGTRCDLVLSAVASLSEKPNIVKAVFALLRGQSMTRSSRRRLVFSAVDRILESSDFVVETVLTFDSLSENPGITEAVLMFLQDPRVDGGTRCYLAASFIASFLKNPSVVEAVLTLLRDPCLDREARCYLASSAVASLSEKPGFVEVVLTLLRDPCIDDWGRCHLAARAIASLPENPNVEEAVLMLFHDPCVDGSARCYAAIFIDPLPEKPGFVAMVLTLLRDSRVDREARCDLAARAINLLPENPSVMEAGLMFLRDQSIDELFRRTLAESVCQHCAKWPNKILAFFDSLFAKDRDGSGLSHDIDIPVHLILPLYEKTHKEGRKYIKDQLVKHRVLIYDRAGTVLVRQAGQIERPHLSRSTIEQVKQAFQFDCLRFDNPASAASQQRFFATSTTANSSSSQHTKRRQTPQQKCTIT